MTVKELIEKLSRFNPELETEVEVLQGHGAGRVVDVYASDINFKKMITITSLNGA